MSIRLEKCTSCARHVRQSEVSCPFCGLLLPASFHLRRDRPSSAGRLSRAALWALGASSVGLVVPLAACTGDDTTSDDVGSPDAAYGGPHPELNEAGADGTTSDAAPLPADADDAADDAPVTLDAAYGGPPPPHDAGEDASDADASDDAADADASGH